MKQGLGLGKQWEIFSLHLNYGAEGWALEIPLTKQRETPVGNNHPRQDSSYKGLTEQRGKTLEELVSLCCKWFPQV